MKEDFFISLGAATLVLNTRWPRFALYDRLLAAIGRGQYTGRIDDIQPAALSAPLFEREFSIESQAEEFCAVMIGHGYIANLQHNVYDYSWSVEVFGAPRER